MATQDVFSGEEAKARLNQLPPDIRALIYSADMTNIIRTIGAAHGLHIDQIGNLESETSFLMLGFTDQKDFPEVLAKRVPVDASVAQKLATEVHDQLLVKIRESLHTMYPGAIDPVTGSSERQAAPPLQDFVQSETPRPVVEKPPQSQLHPPPISGSPAPAHTLSSVDAALSAPQSSSQKSVGPTPAKQGEYKSDPYLEPIE